ncbi:MAG: DUF4190 domain-containing protein [Pseudonocardiaceae bacterium]
MIPQDSQYGQVRPEQGYRPVDYPAHYPSPASISGNYPPPTNTMAILALTLAFSCWPLALAFGHLARKQIRRTGESGRGLATAGLAIGYLLLGMVVLAIVAIVLLAGAASGAGR